MLGTDIGYVNNDKQLLGFLRPPAFVAHHNKRLLFNSLGVFTEMSIQLANELKEWAGDRDDDRSVFAREVAAAILTPSSHGV